MITVWHHDEVEAGDMREEKIDAHVCSDAIILLLVSSDYLYSDRCYEEMNWAIERHWAGMARVIPVILRPVDYWGQPIEGFPMLPSGAKPVTEWQDRDSAFVDVARAIREIVLA